MLNRRNLYIAVFVISIVGLAFVQYKYLEIGLNLAKVQFNRKMAQASESIKSELSTNNQLTYLVASALQKDTTHFRLDAENIEDASRHFLNDFITEKLVNNGIQTEFTYELHAQDADYYLKSPVDFSADDQLAEFPISLRGYLPERLGTRLVLEVKFRDLNTYFLFQLNGLTLPSLIFLLGIAAVIIWVLRTYYWQRNLITHTNEFINNLTHELKTPVFSIGLATKLLEQKTTEEQRPLLAIIRQQVERLTDHIDKVLNLGSMESGKKIFQPEPVNFRPILQKLCAEFETLVAMEETDFAYELEPGEYHIKAEVFHLENAVNNILDNARKYSDQPWVRLRAKCNARELVIDIEDNGVGIAEQDKKRIFQKYFRVSNGDLYEVKGYGLGLSYVKTVIEKMKGKIRVRANPVKGSTVSILIPLYFE